MTDIDKYSDDFRAYVVSAACSIPAGTAWDSPEVARVWEVWLAARASTPPTAAEQCSHRIADVRNKVVKSGYMCLDCGAVFAAADHDGPRASSAPAVQAVGELVPKWAGQFDSHAQWVNKAQSWLKSPSHRPVICVDAIGRRCSLGADMARARDEDAFPVRYFWECAPAIQPPPSQTEILREVIRMVRGYPDFDADDSPFGIMMDEALAGKVPALLTTIECLTSGQPPPSAKPAPTDPRPVVGIVDERYLRPTNGGEG